MSENIPTQQKRDPKIMEALSHVIDPELFLPITDMGLIYKAVFLDEETVSITMTLTTIGCPLFDVLRDDINKEVKKIPKIRTVDLDLTFDPPWHPDMMSEEAKAEIGFL